eukprot:CAMPEP_0172930854 /NCGR_PEP_ID=MMETSP1075-20121228/219200_1 /TAXON_ID=2916 /ORGANISM="Ceratium fusus, Strain PA161109" /LENGTH=590 /DNA_ID=CAMNT_0013792167 /DNA_START=70 /DNA_END=1844 /DNA_ORIENTATION=-
MATPSADAENQLVQGEGQPLLAPDQKWKAPSKESVDTEWDSTTYDITKLTTWAAFGMATGGAWDKVGLWRCFGLATSLSCSVAIVIVFIPRSSHVAPEKMQKLGTFLNVFVGLLLGFFLSSSMNRWYSCVNAFLELLDAVRSMQMQMTALGVSQERTNLLSRYGLLSAWLLHLSLNMNVNDGMHDETAETQDSSANTKSLWQSLEANRPGLVLPKEKELLMQHSESYALLWTWAASLIGRMAQNGEQQHDESYALLWTWVASLIGRMAQNGEIPPMPSPTYGRILNIVQEAFGSIRDVRALRLIKAPFIYAHTLAVLVHVNNILNAIGFGLVLGLALLQVLGNGKVYNSTSWANICCSLFMQFCFSVLAPLLYLALLEVAVCIAQPFKYQSAKIPALKLLRGLEEDLKKAATMGDNPPHWDKPFLIGRMAQNGEIPPMPSPTYGRILNIVQEAYGSIRDVRMLQLIKAPFIYVHTLAFLVHVNNILNAIAFGLVLGMALLEVVGKRDVYNRTRWANMCCSLFMQFFFSMVAPLLYLALLEVAVCVAQPFTYQDAKIPAFKFLKGLEGDLKNAAELGDNPPYWDKPCFKTK